MKLFSPPKSKWQILIPFYSLSLAALACASLIPSPVQTLPAPTVEVSSLPTDVPSLDPTEIEPASPPDVEIPSVLGEDIPIASVQHIEEGAQATDWNSDPPTSGQHYGQWVPAGFYDEEISDGYLVHNMEHGYVVIYYNCDVVADMDCESFKTAIEAAIAAAGIDPETGTVKVLAVPRPAMENPITYASWGHLYKADTFSPDELVLYVQTYRSNPDYSPEWNLP
jgi:hypothetical protein